MSFDLLAPHYRWMEWVLAGGKLQRCRTAYVPAIKRPHRVLLIGEGNGRFLVELLRAVPDVEVTCVDASAAMLCAARERLLRNNLSTSKIEWIHCDILAWRPNDERYDLIVTHFVLDCFPDRELNHVIRNIAEAADDGVEWLLADFNEPSTGFAKHRARLILRAMYLFFRFTTRIPANKLVKPDDLLTRYGFSLRQRVTAEWGLLHSDLWERS